MTRKLYDTDAYIKQFTATVLKCETCDKGFAVITDCTAFFPEGGGQAADRGTLGGANVLDVQMTGDMIVHYLDASLKTGDRVEGLLDWDTRYDRMQNHSGEHIISGIVHRLYGFDNVGFHLSDEVVTLDFDGTLSRDQLEEIELLSNEVIWRNAQFECYYPNEQELQKLQYRSKKELSGAVRIVAIEGCDICACCAPHVSSAAEIGMIKLLDSVRMRGGVRIFIKCGKRALADYEERYLNTVAISNLLSVKQNEVATATERLYAQLSAQKAEYTTLKKRFIDEKINSCTKDCRFIFENGLDMREIQLFADGLYRRLGGVRAVFSALDENGFSFAICGDEKELDSLFADFKAAFQVRGGGRNGMVQGTVLASEAQIKSYFHF